VLAPDSVSVVAVPSTMSPPEPAITPEKMPAPAVSVRVSVPRVTPPVPDSVVIEAAVAEISKVPLSTTPELSAMLPPTPSARVSPEPMVVVPV